MKITEFNVLVSQREGKEQQISIAQISEAMAVANKLLNGKLYTLIREKDKEKERERGLTSCLMDTKI